MRISVGNIVMLRKMKIFCQNDCFLMFLKTLLLKTIRCLRWFAGWSCFILMILKRLWLQLDTSSYDPNLTCTRKYSRFETKTLFCKFMKLINSMVDNSPVIFYPSNSGKSSRNRIFYGQAGHWYRGNRTTHPPYIPPRGTFDVFWRQKV